MALHLERYTTNYHIHHDFDQEVDRYIPVAAARVGRRSGASPSKRRLEP